MSSERSGDEELRRGVESLMAQSKSPETKTSTALAPGAQLGPYLLGALLGSGGMGRVYKARDTRLDRSVAIKVCHGGFSERFLREARAIAALNHPFICTLHDIGPDYLVMEHVEGKPPKGPLPLDKVVEYGSQICDPWKRRTAKGSCIAT
jgi:serine/threonine protein kinase